MQKEDFIKTNKRNQYGVKSACDTYRTVNGVLYQHYTSHPSPSKKTLQKEMPHRSFIKRGDNIFINVVDFTDFIDI